MAPAAVDQPAFNSECLLSEAPPADMTPAFGGLPGAAAHSRLVQRLRRRYADELPLLAPGIPRRDSQQDCLAALRQRGHDTGAALRILRQLVMERLVVLDCEQGAPLDCVTLCMTELAELALDAACADAFAQLDERHGAPLTASGQRAQLWVVGMGKLGARELNVSSDIDLIYIYDQDGETAGRPDGRGQITVHEYFSRAVKRIYALVGETTEHGFVFRVDLALRPNGNSGPAVCSLDALAEYMQVQGREWERFAWLKSRVIAPRAAIASGSAQALRGVVLPFVFRKYLDYNVFEALRTLHRQIREHACKRAAGRPERANDVKLSRGGIREIEFTVQLLQVVRGGQFPELRTRPTLQALQRVARAALMPPDTAAALARAYTWLRRVEHRIQYLDDQQTHLLPTQDADLDWIARTLGHANASDFLTAFDTHREFVAQEFDRLLGGTPTCRTCCCRPGPDAADPADLADLLPQLPERVRQHLQPWQGSARLQALREQARARLLRLLQRTAQWLSSGRASEEAAVRFIDWLETLLRRESYIALLLERPAAHERLLRVLGAARWPARYLMQHPGVIDELANPRLLDERFNPAAFEQALQERRAALARSGEDDEENLLNLLRRAHHAEILRTLVRDVEGRISVEQVADDLSALADSILRLSAQWCWPLLRRRHRSQPQFGIIAYGKLGGKELGYGSDLDIVFVFDDEHEDAPEIYAAYVRKLITWLTTKTGEGDLFEIDTALRPNGNSGLLVTSFQAYADYQQNRGSNTAWTWEHQAMTRARLVLAAPPADSPAHTTRAASTTGASRANGVADQAAPPGGPLAARFDAVRHAVITALRDQGALRREIAAMRQKMRAAHPCPPGQFDIKHSPGGMIDAEFATQYLVLAHSAQHPQLEPNLGNIALLARAEDAGLLPPGTGRAAGNAYRHLRRVQHIARLDEAPTRFALQDSPQHIPGLDRNTTLQAQRDAILALWQAVFGAD